MNDIGQTLRNWTNYKFECECWCPPTPTYSWRENYTWMNWILIGRFLTILSFLQYLFGFDVPVFNSVLTHNSGTVSWRASGGARELSFGWVVGQRVRLERLTLDCTTVAVKRKLHGSILEICTRGENERGCFGSIGKQDCGTVHFSHENEPEWQHAKGWPWIIFSAVWFEKKKIISLWKWFDWKKKDSIPRRNSVLNVQDFTQFRTQKKHSCSFLPFCFCKWFIFDRKIALFWILIFWLCTCWTFSRGRPARVVVL